MKPIDHSNLINLILITLAYFSFQTSVSANATDQSEPPILQAGLLQTSNDEPLLASSAAPVALSTTPDSFIRYFRYPIEPPAGYITMDETEPEPTPTAYYRDVYAGAETFLSISGPVASETWRVDWLLPNNQVKQTTIRYFSSYNGYRNCFIGDRVICGITSVRAYWYIPARCQPSGTYTMTFYDNGIQYDQRQFKLLPQIKEGNVPRYDQTIYNEQYDGLTDKFFTPIPISKKGCALTSLAMILSYHGIKGSSGTLIKPDELNTLLKDNGGYTFLGGGIIWDKVSTITNGVVHWDRSIDFGNLERSICDYGPQMVGAEGSANRPNTHFMVTTGLDTDRHFMLNDPWHDPSNTWYGQKPGWTVSNSARGFVGPGVSVPNPTGSINIYLHSPAELLVTDPQGRKLGLDPRTEQSYKEIPKSYYEEFGLADMETGEVDPPPMKELSFESPLEGEYILDVIGTGSGTYALEVHAFDVDKHDSSTLVDNIPITPNEQQRYRFYFSGTGTAPLEFIANFNGNGQNTKVNSLLSYNAPTNNRTQLPAGTDAYTVSVFYSRSILSQSFRAVFNGADISSAFHPIPGTNERVTLPLTVGRNLLHLTVEGDINGRIATDSDRLTLIVP